MSTIVEEQVVEAPEVPVVGEEEARRREVLLEAAQMLERDGWTAGLRGMRAGGPHCILGAVAEAMNETPKGSGFYDMRPPAALIGVRSNQAYHWNDPLYYTARGTQYRKHAKKRVTTALRRLANGASWDEATRR